MNQEKPRVKRCECGFRIRGPNHNEGEHHKLATKMGRKNAPVGQKH